MTDQVSEEEFDDKYVPPRNKVEGERLKKQHQLVTEAFDGRLIIDEIVELKEGHRVLDSGTGTASWILDLLKVTPRGVDIVGIDISTTMVPSDMPRNVSIHEMSVTNLPSSWDGSFDFVNQRFLIAAFTKKQWQAAIIGLFRILRTGGNTQITEVDYYRTSDESTELPATKLCNDYMAAVFENRNLLGFDCWSKLPILLENVGFVDTHVEVRKEPLGKQWGKLGIIGSQNWIRIYRMFGLTCLGEGGLGVCGSQVEVESVIEQAKREWDENPGAFIPVWALTARKPL